MTQPELGTVEVMDLNEFVSLLTNWHQTRVAQLEHLLTIPEGTEASLGEDKNIVLSGDSLTGFLIGLTTGLSHLGKLPFVAEFTQDDQVPLEPN